MNLPDLIQRLKNMNPDSSDQLAPFTRKREWRARAAAWNTTEPGFHIPSYNLTDSSEEGETYLIFTFDDETYYKMHPLHVNDEGDWDEYLFTRISPKFAFPRKRMV